MRRQHPFCLAGSRQRQLDQLGGPLPAEDTAVGEPPAHGLARSPPRQPGTRLVDKPDHARRVRGDHTLHHRAKGDGEPFPLGRQRIVRLSACRDVGYESLKVPHRPVPTTNGAHILDDPEGRAIPAAHLRFKIVDRLAIPELREKLRPAPRLDI